MKKNRQVKLKTQLILGTSIIVFAVVVGTTFVSYLQSRSILLASIENSARSGALQDAEIISNWVQAASRELDAVSGATGIRGMNWSEQQPMLEGILEDHPDYEALFVSGPNGMAQTTSGQTLQLGDTEHFHKTFQKGEVSFSDPLISPLSGKLVFTVMRPIIGFDDSSIVGVLGAAVKFDYVENLVMNARINGYGHGWLIDRNQNTIAHPEKRYIGSRLLLEENTELQPIGENMTLGENKMETFLMGDTPMTIAYAPVEVTGWSIATMAQTSDVLSSLTTLRKRFFPVLLAALLLGVGLASLFADRLAKPISALKDNALLIAQGDLRHSIQIDRQDEIGLLAQAFSEMVESLKSLITSVQQSADLVQSYSFELSTGTEETGASISQVADTAVRFASTVEAMNTSAQQMSATARGISAKITDGERALERTVTQTADLRGDLETLSESITKLEYSSNEIQDIVEVIREIAEQTNLLALNASIEAARAGEHGRGFAVVAEEIRHLSDRSKQATLNIAQSMEDIGKETQNALENMNQGIRKAQDTASVVRQSGQVLQHVLESTTELADQIQEITSGVLVIGDGSQELAAATEEQSAIIQNLASSANELNGMADELRTTIARFQTGE